MLCCTLACSCFTSCCSRSAVCCLSWASRFHESPTEILSGPFCWGFALRHAAELFCNVCVDDWKTTVFFLRTCCGLWDGAAVLCFWYRWCAGDVIWVSTGWRNVLKERLLACGVYGTSIRFGCDRGTVWVVVGSHFFISVTKDDPPYLNSPVWFTRGHTK